MPGRKLASMLAERVGRLRARVDQGYHDRAERNEAITHQIATQSPKEENIITIPDAAGDNAGSDKRTLGSVGLL